MSTLPPLVCDTPPPIEDDEDFADDFTEFEGPDFDETPPPPPMTLDEKLDTPVELKFSPPTLNLESPESLDLSSAKSDPEPEVEPEPTFLDEDPFTIDEELPDSEVVNEIEEVPETTPKLFDFPVREEPDGSEGDDTKPELSTSFDEFCDFRTGEPPDKKQTLSEKWTEPPQWEPNFEVNFEATFPDEPVDNVIAQNQIPPQYNDDDDDDDDDFGDFTEAPTTTTFQQQHEQPQEQPFSQLPPLDVEKFVEILNLMFPKEESQDEGEQEVLEKVEGKILMKDIENSEALTYKYANSRSSATLMDSIGIDSKNVLYGMKWNSSMPRFAANLSFDPIQPQTVASRSASAKECGSKPVANIPLEPVPAAQFDWSSAGLVNPLDGPAEISITHQTEDSTSISSPEEKPATLNAPNAVTYIEDDFVFAAEQPSYSMRTITLPETHIFTPEKGTNTISQSVDREAIAATVSPPSQTKGIVIKEYRDIEYSLDKCLKPESVLSAPPNAVASTSCFEAAVIEDELVDSCRNSQPQRLDPKKDIFPIFGTSPTESPAPKPTIADDDEFSDFQAAPPPIEPLKPKPINPLPLSPEHLLNSTRTWSASSVDDDEMLRIEAFARSKVIPAPPVRTTDEDEWSDFVSVPPKPAPSDDDWSDFVFTTPASSQPIMTATKSWNSPLPPTYTAGNYPSWSTGQSTTPAIRQNAVPELNFVASKPNVIKHQFMRK